MQWTLLGTQQANHTSYLLLVVGEEEVTVELLHTSLFTSTSEGKVVGLFLTLQGVYTHTGSMMTQCNINT